MARENDVTEGASENENAATQRARQRAIPDAPLSAERLAELIATASERAREESTKAKESPLPEVVRASVRAGYETTRQVLDNGQARLVTQPEKLLFKADETGAGKECLVEHGRPVMLKRDAFKRYLGEGVVIRG